MHFLSQAASGYKATRCRADVVERKTGDESDPLAGSLLDQTQAFQIDNDYRVDTIGEPAASRSHTDEIS